MASAHDGAALDASSPTDGALTPSESFPYLHSMPSLREPDQTSVTTAAVASRSNRLTAFFQLNAVQRCLSAAVLAPLVTIFIWLSPAFATATVCSFVTSVCSYEYACIANRIQLRLLTRLDAFEGQIGDNTPVTNGHSESATSHHSMRSSDSATDANGTHVSRGGSWQLTESPSALRGRSSQQQQHRPPAVRTDDVVTDGGSVDDDRDFRGMEMQLRSCAVAPLATWFFGGYVWLAAGAVSLVLSVIMSAIFLCSVRLIPQLQSTEFYASRVFYTVTTDFVAGLCACYTPNWRYAVICLLGNAVFTILTMHSTICPINQLSCGLSVEPAQVFLAGAVVLLLFRFATSRSGPHAFVNFLLDVLGHVYIIGSLSVLVSFVDDDKKTLYRKLLIALLYIVWASDTGAYLTGKALAYIKYTSTHPLAAHLSKNKDYEGTLGAVFFGIAAMMIASHLLSVPGSTGTKIAFTVLGVVAGRLGDLFESLLKRAAGVKDSGKLIPGHGGVLDRIDALMFATLVFARYYALVIGVGHNEQRR